MPLYYDTFVVPTAKFLFNIRMPQAFNIKVYRRNAKDHTDGSTLPHAIRSEKRSNKQRECTNKIRRHEPSKNKE